MALRAEICLEVPFHDVDMMGIVWHGRVTWAEIAYLFSNAATSQVAVKRDDFELCDVMPEAISARFEGEPWDS